VVKKILLTLVLLVVVCAGVVLALAMTKPNTYHVERKTEVAASPATVYSLINDFQRWPDWSPWEHLDPAMKRTIGTPSAGVGATYAWVGNDKVGEGKMTINESVPDSKVDVRLDFIKPFASSDHVIFDIQPSGAGTEVTWSMTGDHNIVSKVMCVFTSMDKMIGPDFERGLGALKNLAEKSSAATDSTAKS